LVTIQDRKWGRQNTPQTNCDYYLSYVVTITDYHAFGSTITERSASFGGGYRFGFNTQEKEVELGDGVTTAEFWMYDGKLGRRWNVDPRPNVSFSVFACFGNNPILFNDVFGDTIKIPLIFAKKSDHIFRPAILILKNIPEANTVLRDLQQSKEKNVYLMMHDADSKPAVTTLANTQELEKEYIDANGKIDIEKWYRATEDPDNRGMARFANGSGFNFNTKANIFLVSLSSTNDIYLLADKYDRAFAIIHELFAHVRINSESESKDHEIFGGSEQFLGMRLYDKDGFPIVRPNTPAWTIFKKILKQKIDDGNADQKNKDEYEKMVEEDKRP
jgi:hypothetical protein